MAEPGGERRTGPVPGEPPVAPARPPGRAARVAAAARAVVRAYLSREEDARYRWGVAVASALGVGIPAIAGLVNGIGCRLTFPEEDVPGAGAVPPPPAAAGRCRR